MLLKRCKCIPSEKSAGARGVGNGVAFPGVKIAASKLEIQRLLEESE